MDINHDRAAADKFFNTTAIDPNTPEPDDQIEFVNWNGTVANSNITDPGWNNTISKRGLSLTRREMKKSLERRDMKKSLKRRDMGMSLESRDRDVFTGLPRHKFCP